MASGDCPPSKKLKVEEENEDIFMSFHENRLHTLKDGIALMNFSVSGYGVGVVKIKSCNADSSKCFSEATCDCKKIERIGFGCCPEADGVKMRGIFQDGFQMLEAYIESPRRAPRRKGARIALAKLLKFLSDIESFEKILALQFERDISESEWTTIVAHHLLSKLAVGSNYIIDEVRKGKNKDSYCTCGCNERLFGCYGDTSMGVPPFWHGRVDILMDVPVTIATEEPDSSGGGNLSSVETKDTSDWIIACKEEIRAKTIVFSFLKKKNHPELDNFLIPTIAMSKTKVEFCLYDCENDIFLETPLLDLFRQEKFLKFETIITLWLVLNYEYCCSGVPEELMDSSFKADFSKHIDADDLENYIYNVRAPCYYKTEYQTLTLRLIGDVKKISDDININNIPS